LEGDGAGVTHDTGADLDRLDLQAGQRPIGHGLRRFYWANGRHREWRDYGISTLRDVAIFSVFRRTAEHPLYRIEKRPKLRARQGLYAVVAMDGQILRRGHDLGLVLKVLERKLIRMID
jgi:hypothetical protein